MPPNYNLIRTTADKNLRLVRGGAEQRLFGLGPLLEVAVGKTVLDIGCHVGTVAEAFAQRGAALIHGVDIYRPGLRQARDRLLAYKTRSRIKRCDLVGGVAALRVSIPKLARSYDIVLYLGMHHHLAHQMGAAELDRFTDALLALSGDFFAARTPVPLLAKLHERLTPQFTLWASHEDEAHRVGPMRIYRRDHRSPQRRS